MKKIFKMIFSKVKYINRKMKVKWSKLIGLIGRKYDEVRNSSGILMYKDYLSNLDKSNDVHLEDTQLPYLVQVYDRVFNTELKKYFGTYKGLSKKEFTRTSKNEVKYNKKFRYTIKTSRRTIGAIIANYELNDDVFSSVDISYASCTSDFLVINYELRFKNEVRNHIYLRELILKIAKMIKFDPNVYPLKETPEYENEIFDSFLSSYLEFFIASNFGKLMEKKSSFPKWYHYTSTKVEIKKYLSDSLEGKGFTNIFYNNDSENECLLIFKNDEMSILSEKNSNLFYGFFPNYMMEAYLMFFINSEEEELDRIVSKYVTSKKPKISKNDFKILLDKMKLLDQTLNDRIYINTRLKNIQSLEYLETSKDGRNKFKLVDYELITKELIRTRDFKSKIELYFNYIDKITNAQLAITNNRIYKITLFIAGLALAISILTNLNQIKEIVVGLF